MKKTKLFVIGGFLGAGKTTSILNIAKHLAALGKKIAIVTNDQGSDLVDTNFLLKAGLPVLEVNGGCFCCNFEEFTSKVNQLSEELMPDLVLAEPVGSCTDLIATIFKPIQLNYTKQFTLGPLSIVVDPKRVKKLIIEKEGKDILFPSEINYLFRKQLEEADIIVLNKIDTLSSDEVNSIIEFLQHEFKGIEVATASARRSLGIQEWINKMDNFHIQSKDSLDINYETYAKAEEFLGWLNSSVIISSQTKHDANEFIKNFMETTKQKLKEANMEIAHLKIYEVSESDWAKASITSILDSIDFNKSMETNISKANIIINARVNTSPENLEAIIVDTLRTVCSSKNITIEHIATHCFKPGKPNPTFRIK